MSIINIQKNLNLRLFLLCEMEAVDRKSASGRLKITHDIFYKTIVKYSVILFRTGIYFRAHSSMVNNFDLIGICIVRLKLNT